MYPKLNSTPLHSTPLHTHHTRRGFWEAFASELCRLAPTRAHSGHARTIRAARDGAQQQTCPSEHGPRGRPAWPAEPESRQTRKKKERKREEKHSHRIARHISILDKQVCRLTSTFLLPPDLPLPSPPDSLCVLCSPDCQTFYHPNVPAYGFAHEPCLLFFSFPFLSPNAAALAAKEMISCLRPASAATFGAAVYASWESRAL